MREILFRGYNTAFKKWCYGNLIVCDNGEYIITDDYVSVKRETVGQYTGLTDKNGTKIFEGDIVKGTIVSQWGKAEIICCVEWHKNGFVCIEQGKWERKVRFAKNIQVIGNIHDNPELLGGCKND